MDEDRRERIRYYSFAALVGTLLLLNWLGIFKTLLGLDTAIIITLLAGYKTFYNSVSALLEKRISADIALCIAVIAALSVGQNLAAAEAMFIVLVGEGLESYAAGRTAAAIHRFVEQMPRRATLLREGREEEVDADTLAPGDHIVVRAGERIPADGVIEDGCSTLDESSVTGEPLPREKNPGDEVFSATLNGGGLLRIQVSRAGDDTTLARVVRLVREAQEKRAPVERLADRAAKYFLPALLLAAAATFYFTRDSMRTVAVLIVACPCALILATPTAMVAAIGGLARRGILVRGGSELQRAAEVDTVIFDKTGTITEGEFEIVEIVALDRSENELLAIAAAAERASDHPLARIIEREAVRRGLIAPAAESAQARPGRGVECRIGGLMVRAGNAAFLAEAGIFTDSLVERADRLGAAAVLISAGDSLAGAILLRDRLREGAREASAGLTELGITRQVMLTGDRPRVAEVMARQAGIPEWHAGLLPEQKVDQIRQIASGQRKVAMIGDGINDAPALAAAHIGIAVAGASDIAAEAAGAVFLPHSLETLPVLFETSRRAVATAWQNIILFAGLFNLAAVLCAASGMVGPIGAAATHQLSSFLVMMNSLRLLRPGGHYFGRVSGLAARSDLPRLWARIREYERAYQRAYQREFQRAIDPAEILQWLLARKAALVRAVPALAALAILLNGFYIVGPAETGIVQRFGRRLLPYREPGLHYKLPWPIDRLTRIRSRQVRAVEIGFRSTADPSGAEPAAYEWSEQHRAGRFQKQPEESLMLTGDQNMIELNATVHYDLSRPDDFLFNLFDAEGTLRDAAESAMRSAIAAESLDDVLTTGRIAIEEKARAGLQERLDRYGAGVRVLSFRLEDVHPSVEVVDAFREVSAAYEEKNRLVNEAEGYRSEQIALARGNAKARLEQARQYALGRVNRAEGDAVRFTLREVASRAAPGPNETRLYLETLEQVLPGKKKLILDPSKAPRRLFLMDGGIEIGGPGMQPLFAPDASKRLPEER
jgi:Cu+-exporting ATPase